MVEIPVGGWVHQPTDRRSSGDVYDANAQHMGRLTAAECTALAQVYRRKRGSFPANIQGVDGWLDVFVMGNYERFQEWSAAAVAWNEAHAKA
jgi:hypothetical protein